MCSLLLWCHCPKALLLERARKYMSVDAYPNHFHIHPFTPLIISVSIYLPNHWSSVCLSTYHPPIYISTHHLSTYLPIIYLSIYYLSITDPAFTWILASPVQHYRVYFRFLPFWISNSLLLKWESCLHLLLICLLNWSIPLTGLPLCGYLLSLSQLWFHILSSTWTASHLTWALTLPISPLQGRSPHLTGALIPLTMSPISPLLGLQHPTRGHSQHGRSPVPAWALPPAPGEHSLKMLFLSCLRSNSLP